MVATGGPVVVVAGVERGVSETGRSAEGAGGGVGAKSETTGATLRGFLPPLGFLAESLGAAGGCRFVSLAGFATQPRPRPMSADSGIVPSALRTGALPGDVGVDKEEGLFGDAGVDLDVGRPRGSD